MLTPTDLLAASITKKSSLQTYYTIRLLVDRHLVNDCFKAYAYFRWADDQVDNSDTNYRQCLDFIRRQKKLIDDSYRKLGHEHLLPQEKLITELIAHDTGKNTKLASFIRNFFAIIEFDVHRKGSPIREKELDWYSQTLAKAVTDGIEHFINNTFVYPSDPCQYHAAIGAHIAHMLRDYHEDIPQGFINIPKEYIAIHRLGFTQTNTSTFKDWVKLRSKLAQQYFNEGKTYIAKLPVLRGKIAATWYCTRFEGVMEQIKKDGYSLRAHYDRRGSLADYYRIANVALSVTIKHIFQKMFKASL